MPPIHYVVTGTGRPPIVFVHGFACAHADWRGQVEYFSPRHQTVAVDLRGHGNSPGTAAQCSIKQYGADVAEVLHTLDLASAVLIGHSMGCRVVVEAALQAPARTAAVVLVDGSQFAPAMETALEETFARPDGYRSLTRRWFENMFAANSDPAVVASVLDLAAALPEEIGKSVLLDMLSYDTGRFATALASIRMPVLAVQSTYSNDKRERRSMTVGQNTPYLDMLRSKLGNLHIEIIPDTGHFPQIEQSVRLNTVLDSFIGMLTAP
jgi:pimeloyl-ACP methyl ester carboxylesterase